MKELVKVLIKAQKASDSAKATAANGVHYNDYDGGDSPYGHANYHRSRQARARRYSAKETALREASDLAFTAGVEFGVAGGVVYFDLPTGQVSFHTRI